MGWPAPTPGQARLPAVLCCQPGGLQFPPEPAWRVSPRNHLSLASPRLSGSCLMHEGLLHVTVSLTLPTVIYSLASLRASWGYGPVSSVSPEPHASWGANEEGWGSMPGQAQQLTGSCKVGYGPQSLWPRSLCLLLKISTLGTSLVAQWISICLSRRGTRFHPACLGAMTPMGLNVWAPVPEPGSTTRHVVWWGARPLRQSSTLPTRRTWTPSQSSFKTQGSPK